jgi:thiamine-phosphate diphosphorylase
LRSGEKMKKIGRFHVLTDTRLQNRFSHVELAELAIAGGADTVQFRQKEGTTRMMIRAAGQMQDLCKKAGVTFIINDRVDVAIASHADGVHLGGDDFPIPLARRLLGEEAIIGGSAGSMEEARRCLLEGADYIGFGPVYPTSSKEDAGPAAGLSLVEANRGGDSFAHHCHRRDYRRQYPSANTDRGTWDCRDLCGLLSKGPQGCSRMPSTLIGGCPACLKE